MSESSYKRNKNEDFLESDEELRNVSSKKKSKKTTPKRVPPTPKAAKKEGSNWLSDDSDIETEARQKADRLPSYFSQRVCDGTVRRQAFLEGDLVAEVRLYSTEDIKNLKGIERCEKAFVWLRLQGDGESDEFLILKKFMKCAKGKFTSEGTFFGDKKK